MFELVSVNTVLKASCVTRCSRLCDSKAMSAICRDLQRDPLKAGGETVSRVLVHDCASYCMAFIATVVCQGTTEATSQSL